MECGAVKLKVERCHLGPVEEGVVWTGGKWGGENVGEFSIYFFFFCRMVGDSNCKKRGERLVSQV